MTSSIYTPEFRERVLTLRSKPMSHNAVAKDLGCSVDAVEYVVRRAREDGDARAVARRRQSASTEGWSARQSREARYIPVPSWVDDAGIRDLDIRYLSIAETRGPQAAHQHCRAIIAARNSARRPAAGTVQRGDAASVPADPARLGDDVSRLPPGDNLRGAAGALAIFASAE